MWLLIDNYDSFSYILADYLLQLHPDVLVIKNDQYSHEEIIQLHPERLIISPGPGHPDDIPMLGNLIKHYEDKIPILGICLGHQAIGVTYGARCIPSGIPKLGKTSRIKICQPHPILDGIDVEQATIMHYHSLMVDIPENGPLINICVDEDDICMMVHHKDRPYIIGIQFHPESVLTNIGMQLLDNWRKLYL